MKRIDGFDAAVTTVFDTFFFKKILDSMLSVFELFVGLTETFFGKLFELFIALWIEVTEAGFLDFDTDAAHLKTVGEWREDLE